MSYSEKYRGTEWGQALEPQPMGPPPAQAGGSGGRLMVIILGLVVVAGLVGVGAFILSQPGAPTRPIYGARSTAAPTIDRAPLIASFLELTKRPDLTFHLSFESTIQAGFSAIEFDSEMDVAGADQSTTMTVAVGKEKVILEMVVKKGIAYARQSGGRWTKVPADEAPVDPLATIARGATLEYVGSERRDGDRVVHRLVSKDWQLNDVTAAAAAQGMRFEVERTRFEVFVSDEGVPEEARYTAQVSLIYQGEDYPVSMRGTYTFTRFGEPIAIKAPKV